MSERYDENRPWLDNWPAIKALAEEFGMDVIGFDPTLSFRVPENSCFSEQMSPAGAPWLLNILQELSDRRKAV